MPPLFMENRRLIEEKGREPCVRTYTILDSPDPLITFTLSLYGNRLVFECWVVTLGEAIEGRVSCTVTTTTTTQPRDWSSLNWNAGPDFRPGNELLELTSRIASSLVTKHADEIAAFMQWGAPQLAQAINRRIHEQWAQLSSLVELRDAALLVARGIAPVAKQKPKEIEIELRGFDNEQPGAQTPLDEIVCTGAAMVHLETMSEDCTWIGITLLDGRRLSANLFGSNQMINAEIDDDPMSALVLPDKSQVKIAHREQPGDKAHGLL